MNGPPTVRSLTRAVLASAVRWRHDRGSDWGEALLAEFDHTTGRWQAVRWTLGGLRVVWQERRARIRRLPRHVRVARELGRAFVVALFISAGLNQFVVSSFQMVTVGMEPTIPIAGRILVDKIGFRLTGLRHGDVVQLPTPQRPERAAIKRVVGLPGDTIDCHDGVVHRNGIAVSEPYLRTDPEHRWTDCTKVQVPAGTFYVLGDHRGASTDSRQWGPIAADDINGRVLLRVWPFGD